MDYTIKLGFNSNPEDSESHIELKGTWDAVKFLFDQYAEAGSICSWITISHGDPAMVMMSWNPEDGRVRWAAGLE